MTSSEIAFAIFIAKHNLPMAVGDEFGLLAKKMWCSTVPVAHPGGEKILTTAFHASSSGCPAFSFDDVDTYVIRPVFARRKQQGDYYQLVREFDMADAAYFGRYS